MSNDEHTDSLAAQAAAWVPPWERPRDEPDRNYQAAHRADAGKLDGDDGEVARPDDDEDRSAAGLSDDDDDFDEEFEGGNPPGYEVSEPAPGEARVDEPQELPDETAPEPTEVHLGGEVPLPESISQAAEAGEDEGGVPVDAPLPPDGDDAGDVFDQAADDDVSDDDEFDLPFAEVVPAGDDDDEAALADEVEFRRGPFGELDHDRGGLAPEAAAYAAGAADAVEALAGAGDGLGSAGDGPADAVDRLDSSTAASDVAADGLGAQTDGLGAAADGLGGAADALGDSTETPKDGGGAAGRHAADGGDLDADQLIAEPAAGSLGAAGRAEAGSAVPVQGRRRGGDVASGEAASRTSASGEAESAGAAAGVNGSGPASGLGSAVNGAVLAEEDEAAAAGALPALEDDGDLAGALEAIMLVVDEPVGELQLAEILEQPAERIARMLDDLSARYTAAGHGFDLRRAAGGWRLYTRPEYAGYVERFVLDGQSVRLTQAALETLAVVAYKQPVTRSRISAIRGVNCDGVMRTLGTRGLIEECGTEGETGAHLYRTTALFLEKLGLNSVDQLPPLAPFLPDDVEEVLDASG